MTTHNDNPNDVFWLARYAHNTLAPVIEALPGQTDTVNAYLYLGISEHPQYGCLNIYVHTNGLDSGVIAHGSINVTKEAIDQLAKGLPHRWQEALGAQVAA